MRILVKIDQKEALRQGIDAPSSTAWVEVDPQELEQWARNVLADAMTDGVDATALPPVTEATPAELMRSLAVKAGKDNGRKAR